MVSQFGHAGQELTGVFEEFVGLHQDLRAAVRRLVSFWTE